MEIANVSVLNFCLEEFTYWVSVIAVSYCLLLIRPEICSEIFFEVKVFFQYNGGKCFVFGLIKMTGMVI